MTNLITCAVDAKKFVFGGKAIFTIVSKATGARFTFELRKAKSSSAYWVYLFQGRDNTSDYRYIGAFVNERYRPKDVGSNAKSHQAIAWFLNKVVNGRLPDNLELWHFGKCGICARRLTVPESIKSGIGPECAKRRVNMHREFNYE